MTRAYQFSRALPLVAATLITVVTFAVFAATGGIEDGWYHYVGMLALLAYTGFRCRMIFKR